MEHRKQESLLADGTNATPQGMHREESGYNEASPAPHGRHVEFKAPDVVNVTTSSKPAEHRGDNEIETLGPTSWYRSLTAYKVTITFRVAHLEVRERENTGSVSVVNAHSIVALGVISVALSVANRVIEEFPNTT